MWLKSSKTCHFKLKENVSSLICPATFKSTKMRCYSHHQPSMTLLGQGQKQIQVSMGGGREQRFVSSVFARRPRGSVKGTTGGCISLWELLRPVRRRAAHPAGQEWHHGTDMHVPQPCASTNLFSAILVSPDPAKLSTAVGTRLLSPISFTFYLLVP